MDNDEARQVGESILGSLRAESYQRLVERYLDQSEHRELIGDSGTRYQVEIQAFWDSTTEGDLRVLVSVDDGGWRAVLPLTTDFIMAPDGSLVGEWQPGPAESGARDRTAP